MYEAVMRSCRILLVSSLGVFAEEDNRANVVQIDENTTFTEVLSFEDLAKAYAKDTGISFDAALESLAGGSSMESLSQKSTVNYGYFTKKISISGYPPYNYRPTVKIYCSYTRDPHYYILEALNATVDRNDGSTIKQFQGSLFYFRENYQTIHFEINGQFYNNGNTYQISASAGLVQYGVSLPVGLYADVQQFHDIIVQ